MTISYKSHLRIGPFRFVGGHDTLAGITHGHVIWQPYNGIYWMIDYGRNIIHYTL